MYVLFHSFRCLTSRLPHILRNSYSLEMIFRRKCSKCLYKIQILDFKGLCWKFLKVFSHLKYTWSVPGEVNYSSYQLARILWLVFPLDRQVGGFSRLNISAQNQNIKNPFNKVYIFELNPYSPNSNSLLSPVINLPRFKLPK